VPRETTTMDGRVQHRMVAAAGPVKGCSASSILLQIHLRKFLALDRLLRIILINLIENIKEFKLKKYLIKNV
jgi:hypothetical protein